MVTTNRTMDKAKAKVEAMMTKARDKDYIPDLYSIVEHVDAKILKQKNKNKAWRYGYNPEHDFVCISKDGTVGSSTISKA